MYVLALRHIFRAVIAVCLFLTLSGCGGREVVMHRPPSPTPIQIPLMEYTIQVGAFSRIENAVRLTERLQGSGLDATYFIGEDRLYRVRFGNYATRTLASQKAEETRAAGIIEEFYIVSPAEYSAAGRERLGDAFLRESIAGTAKRFIGIPYLWGGTSPETGFDCSGLAMTAYRLNGLNLPRSSGEQFAAGRPVPLDRLEKGDLVFFKSGWPGKISHVGIYLSEDTFIHAPGSGKTIRTERLSGEYYRKRFAGGRSYF